MHGIMREKRNTSESTAHTDIDRIVFRYADGHTVTFLPEANRESFSEDDMLQLAIILDNASSAMEWSEVGRLAGAGG